MSETIASLLWSCYGPWLEYTVPKILFKKQFLDLDLKTSKKRKNDLKKTDFGDPLPPSAELAGKRSNWFVAHSAHHTFRAAECTNGVQSR